MSIRFAAIGLNHYHVYGQADALLAAGAELVWYWGEEAELRQEFGRKYPQANVARAAAEIMEDDSLQLVISAATGLYGMLAFVIIAVFVAGLMVGRTPEYLGKKIESYEMKMASIMILIPVTVVLTGTAIAVMSEAGRATIYNPAAHGFSEVLYAFSSAGNSNGSAFAGLGANTPFYNTALGFAMLFARYWLAVPALAIAGSLAGKKKVPTSSGTLPTHTPLFIGWVIGVIIIVGALSFLPALALGPIVEHLIIFG